MPALRAPFRGGNRWLRSYIGQGPQPSMSDKPKAITDFFAPKSGKRGLNAAANDESHPAKKLVTSKVTGPEGTQQATVRASASPAQASIVALGQVQEAQPPQQLNEAELRELCTRNLGIVNTLIQQSDARAEPPSLRSLLAEESWKTHLASEFERPYMRKLQDFLQEEWTTQTIFPPKNLIFRAMNGTPFEQVRVVIIGQDPYHNVGQAMGLSFSVPPGQRVPPSLQNMYKELKSDIGFNPPKHGNLEKWSFQGVLLLNAALTVRAHQANSHNKKGWEEFTTAAIQALSKHRKGLVFLLWGKNAQAVEKLINVSKHHVLKTVHPSGLSANRGFFGCKHFSKANKLLEKEGLPTIDWQLDL